MKTSGTTKMSTELKITDDGSHTLYNSEIEETYHSSFGAIQESMHVFIKNGLELCKKKSIRIFEVGFGTGLNALLAYYYSIKHNITIHYKSIEIFPLDEKLYDKLNYPTLLCDNDSEKVFRKIHSCQWNQEIKISDNFSIEKVETDLRKYNHNSFYDVVFFDAFSPEKQPEMWTESIFNDIFNHCNADAILTTYCAKGFVRRTLQSAGFKVERLSGPPGKREMLRAQKLIC